MNGNKCLENTVKILTNKLNDIQIKKLSEYTSEVSEKINLNLRTTLSFKVGKRWKKKPNG